MKLRHKMLIGSSLLAVLPVLVTATLVSGLSTRLAEGSLIEQAREQLTTIRSLKSQQIDSYFQLVQNQLQGYARDPDVLEALTDFRDAVAGQARTAAAAEMRAAVNTYYGNDFVRELRRRGGEAIEMQPYLGGIDDAGMALQYHYIVKNNSPAGFKHELDHAADG